MMDLVVSVLCFSGCDFLCFLGCILVVDFMVVVALVSLRVFWVLLTAGGVFGVRWFCCLAVALRMVGSLVVSGGWL